MKLYTALLPLVFAGCTSGQAGVDVTTTNTASFPLPSIAGLTAQGLAGLPALPSGDVTTDATLSIDVRKDLDSLSKLGVLSGQISTNRLLGEDLSTLHHIKITIATSDGTMAEQLLSEVDVPANSTALEMPLSLDGAQLLSYLHEGPVDLHFSIAGTLPQRSLTLTHTLTAHIDIAVSGSVLSL